MPRSSLPTVLTILDLCNTFEPLPVRDIAQAVEVLIHTVKQVLLALKDGGMTFAVSPTQNWQLSQTKSLALTSFDSSLGETAFTLLSRRNPA